MSSTATSEPLILLEREGMFVASLAVTPFQMNQYLVGCTKSGEAALVDSGDTHVQGWVDLAAEYGCTITHLLQTHAVCALRGRSPPRAAVCSATVPLAHAPCSLCHLPALPACRPAPAQHIDHVAGLAETKAALPDAPVYLHPEDLFLLKTVKAQGMMFGMGAVTTPAPPDVELQDAQRLAVGELSFQVLHTPGHCPGHVCFHCEAEGVLLAGDLLFAGSIGRTDFPGMGCSVPDMKVSLRRVMQLPAETLVMAGHNEVTSIGAETASNPYLQPSFLDSA